VGPRAGLDDVEKRKFLILPGLELDPSVIQPVASRIQTALSRSRGLIRDSVPSLSWSDGEKPRRPSVGINGVTTRFQISSLRNAIVPFEPDTKVNSVGM
jgi:hypothetical protein